MISLPDGLEHALETIASNEPLALLRKGYSSLSERYRERGDVEYGFKNQFERIAYLIGRFPATYSAAFKVYQELSFLKETINSLLDMGAGAGAATFAAESIFPNLKSSKLLEKDREMCSLGQKIDALNKTSAKKEWLPCNLEQDASQNEADLIVLSYALGELSQKTQEKIVSRAYENCQKLLVIIEPGSVRGFSTILNARTHLLELGGSILAPCPGSMKCPMQEPNWCHFSVRLKRTKSHAYIKEGSQGFEDEKFSYVIFSKEKISPKSSERVLKPLQIHSGHVGLCLCTPDGIIEKTISKKSGDLYKKARKINWGDSLS